MLNKKHPYLLQKIRVCYIAKEKFYFAPIFIGVSGLT